MVIFALDAGFTLPGYAFFDTINNRVLACGAVATARMAKAQRRTVHYYVSHDDARRVREIYAVLSPLVAQYKPDCATIELPVGAGRSSSAVKGMAYASAIGAILVEEHGIRDCVYVTPEQNKLASTGLRDGSKQQVMVGVERRFGDVWERKRGDNVDHPRNWAVADALSTIMYYESL